MISRKDVILAIDNAEAKFTWCWNAFLRLTCHSVDRDDLIRYQNELVDGFVIIDQAYRRVVAEKHRLVANKSKYKFDWFNSRMATLDDYLKALKSALGIGRSLGDGFAWLFYRNETNLLDHHGREKRQLLLPPNLGGIGERTFLKRMQGIGGMLVIYHALTSYLRLGDVSFYDPSTGTISNVGEIKTRQKNDTEIYITLGFVGPVNDNSLAQLVTKAARATDATQPHHLDIETQKKLQRQLDQISGAIGKSDGTVPDSIINSRSEFHFRALESVIKKSTSKTLVFEKAGAGLLIAAWRPPFQRGLGSRILRSTGRLDKRLEPALAAVHDIFDPSLQDNCVFVGDICGSESGFPATALGGVPYAWWPIEHELLRDALFENVILMTFFNPARLWAMLRSRGFEVSIGERSKINCVRKRIGKKTIELGNFERFQEMIPYALMDEEALVSIIENIVEEALREAGDQTIRVNLRPRMVVESFKRLRS